MKHIARIAALVLVLAVSLGILAGCNQDPVETPAGDKVTVTWYNGSEELKSEQVAKGSKLTSWTPTVEGKTFTGWFKEASLTQAFDFETVINEDTDIFAAFKSDAYVEDTNEYYLIGSGAGDMKVSNWNHESSMASLKMTKDTSVTNANVYKITITMYAGDRFQICFGGDWNGQQGIGYIPGCEYADGINPNDNTEYTAADKKYAEVKDADGNLVFIGGDEYNKESFVWNVILAEGQDGKYEFTLTTYPDNMAYNTIEWKLVEKVEAQEETHNMQIIGTNNEWGTDGTGVQMSKSEDGSCWTGFLTVTPEMWADWLPEGAKAAVKVYNIVDGAYYGIAGENIILNEEATYAFRYDVASNEVTVQKLDYYVVGTFKDADGNAVNFSIKEGVTPVMTVENGIASVTFTTYDVTDMGDYNWMVDQQKPGIMAVKVVYGCELGIQNWYGAEGDDNFYLEAGEYTLTLDIAAGTAAATKA